MHEPLTPEQQIAVDYIGLKYRRVGIVHSGPLAAIAVGYVDDVSADAYTLTPDGGVVDLITGEVFTPEQVAAAVDAVAAAS